MKRLISSAIVLSFIAASTSAGFAQTRPAPTKPSSKVERAAWANKEGLHDTKDIIVVGDQGLDRSRAH